MSSMVTFIKQPLNILYELDIFGKAYKLHLQVVKLAIYSLNQNLKASYALMMIVYSHMQERIGIFYF